MNVRVRQDIKQMAHEIARKHRYTITDVIEMAIERLHAGIMKA
jgi:antitoxin component of RelBE/YafQ-DinJ toxin-antitoxin module